MSAIISSQTVYFQSLFHNYLSPWSLSPTSGGGRQGYRVGVWVGGSYKIGSYKIIMFSRLVILTIYSRRNGI